MKNKNVKKVVTPPDMYSLHLYWEYFCHDCVHDDKNKRISSGRCNLCRARFLNPTQFEEKNEKINK